MDFFEIMLRQKLAGGGGDEPVLIDKTISANGTYNASTDNVDGYKKVVANVPGPSGTINITQNGTVDVTQYASADVNVSGGGGGSSYTLLAEGDFEVSNPSSTGVGDAVKIFQLGAAGYTSNKMIYVRIRLTSEYTKPHVCFTNSFSINQHPADGSTGTTNFMNRINVKLADDTWILSDSNGLVFAGAITNSGELTIRARSHSTYNVNGTYHAEVYALEWPDNISPFTEY